MKSLKFHLQVNFLDAPICAFIRLDEPRVFEGMMEIPLPLRFVFILLGPRSDECDYYQIGRSMATVMSTLVSLPSNIFSLPLHGLLLSVFEQKQF